MLNSFAPQDVFTLSSRCLVVVVRCVFPFVRRFPSFMFSSLSFRVLFCVAPPACVHIFGLGVASLTFAVCLSSFAVFRPCCSSFLLSSCVVVCGAPGACSHFRVAVASFSFAVCVSLPSPFFVLGVPFFSFRVLCVALRRVTFSGCCRVVSVPCAFLFLSVVAVVRFFTAPSKAAETPCERHRGLRLLSLFRFVQVCLRLFGFVWVR